MEQLGQEPKEHEIPPDGDDLPEIVTDAINTFNMLNDRIYSDLTEQSITRSALIVNTSFILCEDITIYKILVFLYKYGNNT